MNSGKVPVVLGGSRASQITYEQSDNCDYIMPRLFLFFWDLQLLGVVLCQA